MTIMRRLLLLAIPAFLLTGCVSGEDQAATDDNQCKSYGAAQGSETYVQCREWAQGQRQQAQQFDRALSATTTPAPAPDQTLTAFCPGFERGYMNGWGAVNKAYLSNSAVPPCPVQPPKTGMQSDFDQGYALGQQLGQSDGRRG
ncbi:hypothetical protein JYU29_17155 [Tianweitania sp. BSSL-BM11]|uniref:Lipoprotein n=1 Tax=Tianweitania aestuarii TaxID=2814886 RepID=A0ABS5RZE2_9HYPH|nr:hypothetical protein [Tianweitania aestuarii]MBS9722424.1 hypothetical protein [Tianweitania aestuarii]